MGGCSASVKFGPLLGILHLGCENQQPHQGVLLCPYGSSWQRQEQALALSRCRLPGWRGGKKPTDRFWVRKPKVPIKAALPSPPMMGTAEDGNQGRELQSSWRGSDPARCRSRAPPGLTSIAPFPANAI